MAEKQAVVSTADEIRKILAAAKQPLTAKEIFDRCDTATETTQVATVLHKELQDGRVERTGERGSYAYAITADGRAAAGNPNLLRSRTHRRTRGRGTRKTAAIAKVVAAAKERKPKGTPRRGRPPANAARRAPAPKVEARADDNAMRLAGAVLTHWPAPLKAMPAELRECVDRTLQIGGTP